ncbi:tetratricopeptide repeat protein, partial [Bradyrhizobium sp. HKCCYLS20291]|uniref:tetratricopeptide repeat protein n=1 Tax=Bradyrhizobium sp. HKCCYLS20291 TaxID=3420766 RepID=UPI003EB93292
RAVTMGKIADILSARGDLDEALRIRKEELLPVFERLGDDDGIAATLWNVALIELTRERFDDAMPRMGEAYAIFLRLGGAEGIAVIGAALGQILAAGEETRGQAREILQRSVATFRRMGRESEARDVEEIIAKLKL